MNNKGKFPAVLLWFLLMFLSTAVSATKFENTIVKVNPDYKLKRLSNNVVVMSSDRQGKIVKHRFDNVYADILVSVYRRQRMGNVMNYIAMKYSYSDEECRREIKHALNVLADWNIVIR